MLNIIWGRGFCDAPCSHCIQLTSSSKTISSKTISPFSHFYFYKSNSLGGRCSFFLIEKTSFSLSPFGLVLQLLLEDLEVCSCQIGYVILQVCSGCACRFFAAVGTPKTSRGRHLLFKAPFRLSPLPVSKTEPRHPAKKTCPYPLSHYYSKFVIIDECWNINWLLIWVDKNVNVEETEPKIKTSGSFWHTTYTMMLSHSEWREQ